MSKVVHFEIPADNTKRAAKFYKTVFAWDAVRWGKMDYWTIDTGSKKGGGVDGAITKRSGLFLKKNGIGSFIITVEVKNLEETARLVKKAGGKWANEGGLIHGVGFHQYFKDSEGNLFGALQPDRKAKMVPEK